MTNTVNVSQMLCKVSSKQEHKFQNSTIRTIVSVKLISVTMVTGKTFDLLACFILMITHFEVIASLSKRRLFGLVASSVFHVSGCHVGCTVYK